MTPPPEMREACCAGLLARSQFGVGGTARSVPFATRVCAGGPVTEDDVVDMLTHMAAIDSAMGERGPGDRALSIAWELWGGDPGREWAERYLIRPVVPVLAAPAAAVPEAAVQPEWVTDLNALAAAEVVLLARVHELMEAGVELALTRLKSKIVAALSKAPKALRAEFDGERTAVLASMAAVSGCPLDAVRLVPPALMAKVAPSVEADATLRAVFAQLGDRILGLVEDHQRKVLKTLSAVGPVGLSARDQMHDDAVRALDHEIDFLMGHVARLASGEAFNDPEGEVPAGKVATSVAFRLLSNAGGGDGHDPTRQDWVQIGSGEVLCVGIALGVNAMRALAAAAAAPLEAAPGTLTMTRAPELEASTVTKWRWGGAAVPFPPHQRLNGQTWATEQEREDVCRNPGGFPSVGVLYPGDHAGCSCSYEVELRITQTKVGQATVRVQPPPVIETVLPNGRPTPPPRPGRVTGWKAAARGEPPVDMPPGWAFTHTKTFKGWDDPGFKVINHATAPELQRVLAEQAVRFAKTNAAGRDLVVEIYGGLSIDDEPGLAQAVTMFERMSEYMPVPKSAAKEMVLRVAPAKQGIAGYASVGSGEITINTAALGRTAAQRAAHGSSVHLVQSDRLSRLESTVVHEWGHAAADKHGSADATAVMKTAVSAAGRPAPASVLDARQAAQAMVSGIEPPSKYAQTNERELVAEAFVDWVVNGDQALESSRTVAAVYGWRKYTW